MNRTRLPIEPSGRVRRGQIFLLSMAHLVNDAYAGFLAPLLPLLVQKFGLSMAAAGFLSSVLAVSSSLSQPLYGYLADRFGRRCFVVLGPLLTAVFMSSLGLPGKYPLLVLTVFAGGVGTAFFHPQGAALAGAVCGNRKGLGMSVFSASGNAGYALGPLFISLLVSAVGLSRMYVAVLPGLVLSLLLWKQIIRMQVQTGATEVGSVREQLTAAKPLLFLWLIVVIRAFVVTSFATFIPLLLERQGRSLIFGGAAVFIFLFCGACGGVLGGYLSDRMGRRRIVLVSMLFSAPFLILFLFTSGLLASIGLAAAGAILLSSVPVVLVMAQEVIPGRTSTVSGFMMGFGWGLGGLAVSLVGVMADSTSLNATLSVVALFPLLGFVFGLFLPQR